MKRVLRMTKKEVEDITEKLKECQKRYTVFNKKVKELENLLTVFDDELLTDCFISCAVYEDDSFEEVIKDENIVVI